MQKAHGSNRILVQEYKIIKVDYRRLVRESIQEGTRQAGGSVYRAGRGAPNASRMTRSTPREPAQSTVAATLIANDIFSIHSLVRVFVRHPA